MSFVYEKRVFRCRLDGRQSISLPYTFYYNGKILTDPINIVVRGFVKFYQESGAFIDSQLLIDDAFQQEAANKLGDKTIAYPVLFETSAIPVTDGYCTVTLLPRSEDILVNVDTLADRLGITGISDRISQLDPTEQLTDITENPATMIIETGKIRNPYQISVEVTITDDTYYGQTIDVPIGEQDETIDHLFIHKRLGQSKNKVVVFFNDVDWIPSVNAILNDNSSNSIRLLSEIEKLENSTPFGISPLYDAIKSSSIILSDNAVDNIRKLIYIFTDNAQNTSQTNIDDAIKSVNDLEGEKRVPVLLANLSMGEPRTLSVIANQTDTRDINKISFLTGGQAITVVSEDFIDSIVGTFFGQSVGAIGYGTFSFTVDLQERALVDNIQALFDIPDDRNNASWSIEISEDGYNFTALNENYTYNEIITFSNTYARYIRFHIVLITGFSVTIDEYTTIASSPALRNIRIVYNEIKKAYLFLNPQEEDYPPSQMAVGVNANNDIISNEQIKVGLAKSTSPHWLDYYNNGQPTINQNGKIFVPIRLASQDDNYTQEPLRKLDRFTLKTTYGAWDPSATVFVFDKNNNAIDNNLYKGFPREGKIVLGFMLPPDYKDGDYTIAVLNTNKYRLGMEISNESRNDPVYIYGLGYMYNTTRDLLPPIEEYPPEATNVLVYPQNPGVFSKITVDYIYSDVNYDDEDQSKTIIKWYINGTHIRYLDNLREWNDVSNRNDPLYYYAFSGIPSNLTTTEEIISWARVNQKSILRAGDIIYYSIQVSNGTLFSSEVTSQVSEVIESEPEIFNARIWGTDATGGLVEKVTTQYPAVLTFNFVADTTANRSKITWYVNDQIFKEGTYGVDANIDRILPSDTGINTIDYGLSMFNEIYAEVTPSTLAKAGEAIISNRVVVENSPPSVSNVRFAFNFPIVGQNITLLWEYFDYEGIGLGDIGQPDNTFVIWYRKKVGENQFTALYRNSNHISLLQSELNWNYSPREMANFSIASGQSVVPSSITLGSGATARVEKIASGEQWYAEIYPYDTFDFGEKYITNVLTIKSSIQNQGAGGSEIVSPDSSAAPTEGQRNELLNYINHNWEEGQTTGEITLSDNTVWSAEFNPINNIWTFTPTT